MTDILSELHLSLPFEGLFALDRMRKLTADTMQKLSASERKELEALRNEKRRREFATSRLLLKEMAMQWEPESELRIIKNELGNPFAKTASGTYEVSIAHSDDTVFCGLTRERPIGVDLEPSDRKVSDRLRARLLHPREKETGLAAGTVRLWTIKEAYIKLRGQGLRLNMNDVCVEEKVNDYSVNFNDDKKAKICSFRHQDHWLAIAFYL